LTRRTLLFLALCLTAAAPAAAAPSCRIPGGQVIATGTVAKLLALPTPDGSALFACIRRTGRKIALDDRYADARLHGRWVAWQRHSGRQWRIDVHDLRTGRERLVDGHVMAHALFLSSTGTVVWAQDLGQTVDVVANERAAGGRVLGSGAIDPASLRLRGSVASWRADGADYTAEVA
jgi:hypothetical protein